MNSTNPADAKAKQHTAHLYTSAMTSLIALCLLEMASFEMLNIVSESSLEAGMSELNEPCQTTTHREFVEDEISRMD